MIKMTKEEFISLCETEALNDPVMAKNMHDMMLETAIAGLILKSQGELRNKGIKRSEVKTLPTYNEIKELFQKHEEGK